MSCLAQNGSALVIATLVATAGCGSDDRGPPTVVAAEFFAAGSRTPIVLNVADPSDPLAATLVVTPTHGDISLIFSELLDADSVQLVDTDDAGGVERLVGRDGIARIAPIDGSRVPSSVIYRPERRAIHVTTNVTTATGEVLRTYMPSGTDILVHLLALRVRDKAGNVAQEARLESGEPVRDTDGRGIAATVAFTTQSLAIERVDIPAFGMADIPGTSADESVPLDASVTMQFNTAVDASSATGLVSFIAADGAVTAVTVAAAASPLGEAATALMITPVIPLAPATAYELRVEPGITDIFSMPLSGEPRLFSFSSH